MLGVYVATVMVLEGSIEKFSDQEGNADQVGPCDKFNTALSHHHSVTSQSRANGTPVIAGRVGDEVDLPVSRTSPILQRKAVFADISTPSRCIHAFGACSGLLSFWDAF